VTKTQAAAVIIGLMMPFLITVLKQSGINRWWNLAIAVITCAGAGTLTVWASGNLTAANILGTIGLVFVAAQTAYIAYWKGTSAEQALNQLTSIIKAAPAQPYTVIEPAPSPQPPMDTPV